MGADQQVMNEPELREKQLQFNRAMDRYGSKLRYTAVNRIVSFINIAFQPVFLIYAFLTPVSPETHLIVFLAAYTAADLVNGIVHMILDNSSGYTGWTGPFVAAFHLHHRNPRYKVRNIMSVYVGEAGFKIWLAIYSLAAGAVILFADIPGPLIYGLVYFNIFSCIAEVSHYCCHVPDPPIPRKFRTLRLLLPKKYHMRNHHFRDNHSYAFLNGMSDPLLNLIARLFFKGYKSTTDLHYALYTGEDTENR